MQRTILLLLTLLASISGFGAENPPTLRVMSWNILYDSPKWGEALAWSLRQPGAAALLKQHRPDVAGFQEVLSRQLLDLQAMLPDYDFVGNVPGPADNAEFPWTMNPIFFRRDRLRVLDTGFWWLTGVDADGVPRIAWPDEGLVLVRPSHAVWVRFLDLETRQQFYHVNLHYPPQSEPARRKAAMGLSAGIGRLAPELPLIVIGDFNSVVAPVLRDLGETGLVDSRAQDGVTFAGPPGTRVDRRTGEIQGHAIDHILVGRGVRAHEFSTLADKSGPRHPSDHLPVLARLALPK